MVGKWVDCLSQEHNPSLDICETWNGSNLWSRYTFFPLIQVGSKVFLYTSSPFFTYFKLSHFWFKAIVGVHIKPNSPGHRIEVQVSMKFNFLWFTTFLSSTQKEKVKCFLTALKVWLHMEFLEQLINAYINKCDYKCLANENYLVI